MTAALTREQLEQRLLALHQASLELVQDISLESLLERIATLACQQAGARYAAVGVLTTDGQLEAFIPVGMAQAEVNAMNHPPVGLGLIGALMKGESIRIASIGADPRSAGFPAHHPAMTSFLGVPILRGGRQLGQIYLTNKQDAPEFSPDDQIVIEMLASYAAVAISNARLYKELIQRDHILTRRNENLALLNLVAATLANSTDIDRILDQVLTQVLDYLHLEIGEIFLRQEDDKTLKLMLHRGVLIPALWKQSTFTTGEGIVGQVAAENQMQIITLPEGNSSELDPAVIDNCFQQIACLPLGGRRGVIGVMCIGTCQARPLDELEMQYLQTISSWVGTAIENVRLNLQGRRLAVLEERERIGMDLHDGIIQSIYAVGLTLEHARLLMSEDPPAAHQRIDQSIADLNSTIRDIRAYILDLRPRQLHNENLMAGLQRLATEFRANTLEEINLQGAPERVSKLPEAQAVALFHICQESLANIAKHARSRRVDVIVWTTNDRVLMEIRDDGLGFDLSNIKTSIGHGLANMQTRARNAGGDVDISSEEGVGTTVLAWVPLRA